MTDLVQARWVAGFDAELPDKTQLVPGVTVVAMPRDQAEASEFWEVLPDKPTKTKGDA